MWRRLCQVCQSPRFTWTAPLQLNMQTPNYYHQQQTAGLDGIILQKAERAAETATSASNRRADVIGAADVVAAAKLPQSSGHLALRMMSVAFAYWFVIANSILLIAAIWACIASASASITAPADNEPFRQLFLGFVLPAVAFEATFFSFTLTNAFMPCLQAHTGLLYGVKYFAMANSAGPFDQGYAGPIGRRRCDQPFHAGLTHARPVQLRTADGQRLGAWHVLPAGRVALAAAAATATQPDGSAGRDVDSVYDESLAAANDERQLGGCDFSRSGACAVIYLHGVGETRTKWVTTEHAKLISAQLGLHTLIFDYRGFGDSSGAPSGLQAGFDTDCAAAISWFIERGVPASRIILWGHSLGTGVAVKVASDLQAGAPPRPLRALVLEAPYTSLMDACRTFPSGVLIRALPFGDWFIRRCEPANSELDACTEGSLDLFSLTHQSCLHLSSYSRWCIYSLCHADFYFDYQLLGMLPAISTPTLIFHGTADALIPFQHSAALAAAVTAQACAGSRFHFVVLPGCGHLHTIFHPKTLGALANFFHSLSVSPEGQATVGETEAAWP
jgi:pimeloyl-ACP methyl ester carboxylesterase